MGTYNLVFVILNVVSPAVLENTKFLFQFSSRWILQLINGISNEFQKLLKYFVGTAIFTFSNTLLLSTVVYSPKKFDLYLKDVELFVKTSTGFPASFKVDPSLLNWHKIPDVSQ